MEIIKIGAWFSLGTSIKDGAAEMDQKIADAYVDILNEELVPALGCTEPIAIAFAAAKAREVLGREPLSMTARCSGNIIKNAKAVYVPNTGGLKGIPASAIAGMLVGDSSLKMRVLERLNDKDRERLFSLLNSGFCTVEQLEGEPALHIIIEMKADGDSSLVEIAYSHTNICRVEKNGVSIFHQKCGDAEFEGVSTDRTVLSIGGIFNFAQEVDISDDLKALLDRQIHDNRAIAEEGLKNRYGVNAGEAILELYGNTIWAKLRAYAAAGSDARMNGCGMPVVINSGSGNQGMTASLPVIIYAEEQKLGQEALYRGLIVSNLVTIHLKSGIGRLSAYCGAMSASAGAGAGITFLAGGTLQQVEDTVTNALADVSGIVCDGAKASCAAKIATGVDAAILAHHLAMKGRVYDAGSGIVKNSVEKTVAAVGELGREGMRETDKEVLKIMLRP